MSILVTGSTGLLGSHLCKNLVSDGYNVVGLTRIRENPIIESLTSSKNFKIEVGDIRDTEKMDSIIKGNDIKTVFHLAAQMPYTSSDNRLKSVNIQGALNMVMVSQKNGVEDFIFASSLSVYSTPPDFLPVGENHQTNPSSMYGITKLVGELFCKCYANPMRVTILRYSGVYGKGIEHNRGIANFVRCALKGEPLKIFGDGTQSSDFVYVGDAVQGTILAWQKRFGGVYNMGSGQETKIFDLANLIIRLANSKSEVEMAGIETDRPFRFVSDITKARNELGYSSRSLEVGMRYFIEEEQRN